MINNFFITHYINQEPSKTGWREIPFITKSMVPEDNNYYLGLEFETPIPLEVINKGLCENYYLALINPVKASTSQSIWITPKGEIWLANHNNPFKNERVLIDTVSIEESPADLISKHSNFDISSVSFDNLPEEINKAWKRLVNQIEEEPDSVRYFNSSQVNIINYGFLNEFNSAIKNLNTNLKGLLKINNISHLSPTEKQVATYDIDERSSLFFSKSFFLYPFYLDHLRKKYSGVIPYAYQTSLAVAIHKDNKYFKKWIDLRSSTKEQFEENLEDWELDLLIEDHLALKWLKDLMVDIHSENGKINFIKGYIFDAVTNEFQSKNLRPEITIDHLNQSSIDIEKLAELDFFKKTTPRYRRLHKDENTILILDPAEAFGTTVNNPYIKDKFDKETYEIFNVKHGLKIPIGIGFSLYALPFLLHNNNWQTLQNVVFKMFQNEQAINKLFYLGIKFIPQISEEQKILI